MAQADDRIAEREPPIGARRAHTNAEQLQQGLAPVRSVTRRATVQTEPAHSRRDETQCRADPECVAAGHVVAVAERLETQRQFREHEHTEHHTEALQHARGCYQQATRAVPGRIGEHRGHCGADHCGPDGKEETRRHQLRQRVCKRVEDVTHADPREAERVEDTPPELVGECAERPDQQQHGDFLRRAEEEGGAALLRARNAEMCVEHERLHEAQEREQADTEESGVQEGEGVAAGDVVGEPDRPEPACSPHSYRFPRSSHCSVPSSSLSARKSSISPSRAWVVPSRFSVAR